MSYKCLECGHIFEEGEQSFWKEPHGERLSGCPICDGSYEECVSCNHCGADHLKEELYDGWCVECLEDYVTVDLFLDFIEEREYIPFFMFSCVYNCDCPANCSDKLIEDLRELFLRYRANDILLDGNYLIKLCKKFVMEDDGNSGRLEYAEWLNEKGVK